jgi:hypothetical protein
MRTLSRYLSAFARPRRRLPLLVTIAFLLSIGVFFSTHDSNGSLTDSGHLKANVKAETNTVSQK